LRFKEPFAVLALMYRGIEARDRQNLIAADEAALVAERLKIGNTSPTLPGARMAISHSKNQ